MLSSSTCTTDGYAWISKDSKCAKCSSYLNKDDSDLNAISYSPECLVKNCKLGYLPNSTNTLCTTCSNNASVATWSS